MISSIVAYDKNQGIGCQGSIPWKLKDDLKFFKKITTGHFVIMGRKTYESIGKALPKRINIVISKNKDLKLQDALVFNNLEQAIFFCKNWENNLNTFIIGGGEIYNQSIEYTDCILATEINMEFKVDTYFPEINNKLFCEVFRSKINEENGIKYQYVTYTKI